MSSTQSYISAGDFIDLFYKIKQKGLYVLFSKFRLRNQSRTKSKWNTAESSSDFWVIPRVRKRWNKKCTGDPDLSYEDYVMKTHLADSDNLKMLSVGCGTGTRERHFATYSNFALIEGIDMAEKQIEKARQYAAEANMQNIRYITGNLLNHDFKPESYDVILFNSSLHHFKNISTLLQTKVKPLLKAGGLLIIFEYVGPNRLQWTPEQLKFSNKVLKSLPDRYKFRYHSSSIKQHIYRPGLLRMLAVDPSEAVDSESILPAIHRHFNTLEEKQMGWDITHLLFKDIGHNFLNEDEETTAWLEHIFDQEDRYLEKTGRSDAVFGVYRK